MKVLLVDDHPLVLAALQTVIRGSGADTTVVGVEDGASARQALSDADDFDLVLLDLALGDEDGFAVLVSLREGWPLVPVVVISASDRAADVIRAIDQGAMGFVPKKSPSRELHEALTTVTTGGMYVPPSMLALLAGRGMQPAATEAATPAAGSAGGVPSAVDELAASARAAPHQRIRSLAEIGLTPRQTEVLSLLLKALPNKLIARQLNLSVETVKDHVAAVLRALGVSTRTQAVLVVTQMMQAQGGSSAPRPSGD